MKTYSVTEVLGKYVDWSLIPDKFLAAACQRGSDVHLACSMYAKLGYTLGVPSTLEGYVLSFTDWFDANVKTVLLNEKHLTCTKFHFTGRPDFVFLLNTDEIVLNDIKTPLAESKTWKGQLAAYDYLVENYGGIKSDDMMSLRLRPDGKPARGVRYGQDRLRYFNYFLSALNAHRGFIG